MMAPGFISAIAIYCVKKWSYPVFLLCMGWLLSQILLNLQHTNDSYLITMTVVAPLVFNIVLVSYFLIPAVKTTYYDPRVRWWEAKPRYIVDLKSEINYSGQKSSGKLANISEGGAFIESDLDIPLESDLKLSFEISNAEFELTSKVIFKVPGKTAYGVQFDFQDKVERKQLIHTIRYLKESGAEVTRPIPLWSDDLKSWFFKLLSTGEGFFPKIPKK